MKVKVEESPDVYQRWLKKIRGAPIAGYHGIPVVYYMDEDTSVQMPKRLYNRKLRKEHFETVVGDYYSKHVDLSPAALDKLNRARLKRRL